jgi:hypothetical protein
MNTINVLLIVARNSFAVFFYEPHQCLYLLGGKNPNLELDGDLSRLNI